MGVTPGEALVYVTAVVGLLVVAVGALNQLRGFFRRWEVIESAAQSVSRAAQIIEREFTSNGGRITTPLRGETEKESTAKELLIDIRTIVSEQKAVVERNEKSAVTRSERIVKALEQK